MAVSDGKPKDALCLCEYDDVEGQRQHLLAMCCDCDAIDVACDRYYMTSDFFRAMLCKRGLCRHAVSVCVFVCVSVTFVDHVKTNKHIFKMFSPSGSHTILVFPCQTAWQYSNENPPPPNGGIECRWGRLKS